ncbi:TfpX/TfpZ family type IV pilin accessory protein [Variovorax sp.]|jgi:hypothetical protein|uniref:TfpX/TfpZ family type IV pilin accessory protein n=1 Tax=Variovorax sp. TaxID=1871043 RepID=UPI0012219D7D|nr:TfpX/TfpZ family type IV pilin accessory protein [Variovorax sp.]TAJ68051.1 MAG: type IV pilin accessory protein [Variovorax sp.]
MMSFIVKNKLSAVGWQITYSSVFLAVVYFFVFLLWYPHPLEKTAEVVKVFGVLALVNLVLGPALTFVLYKEDKKKLVIDLLVMFLLQLIACAYGVFVLAQGRPQWLVFVVDDFEVVRPVDVDLKGHDRLNAEMVASFFHGPKVVAAVYSGDQEIRLKQKQDELILGKSFAKELEAYQVLATQAAKIREKARKLVDLEQFNPKQDVAATRMKWAAATGWLPLKGNQRDMVILLNKEGAVITIADLRPWN